uniref:HTH myb-type domain-containing protein n=1 Tax=Oryza barthii TaxID=65489 RepID=A0A0D3H8Q2_9ORYZ
MGLLRCRKSCCLHWMNYLSPDLNELTTRPALSAFPALQTRAHVRELEEQGGKAGGVSVERRSGEAESAAEVELELRVDGAPRSHRCRSTTTRRTATAT